MTNDKSETTSSQHRLTFVICSFLICSLALRLAPLARYVTPDEPAWVYRSIRFADALAAGDWAAIPLTGHPGVTTMWLGAAGVTVRRFLDPLRSAAHLNWIRRLAWLAPENGEAFRHLAFFLPFGRVAVALATTLGLAILYPLLARLFDRRVALLTVGLLAFDPFLIGHSGLLHTDALLATFCLLTLAAALNGLREPGRPLWWLLSGLFAGLALLTKTPALILLPFVLFLIGQPAVGNLRSTIRSPRAALGHLPSVIRRSSLFILFTATTYAALHPALWADPAGTLHTLFAFAGRHIESAQRPVFFAGQMTYNPGLAFYPLAFLFRVSPVVLTGLVVGLVSLRRFSRHRRSAFLLLVAFAILFGAAMSFGAKKHDRYLLPSFPLLTLAAAVALSQTVWPKARRTNLKYLLPVVVQLLLVVAFAAHPLTFYNPLLGGPPVAARVLPVGWGEGMGAAARWLNRLPEADELTVAAASTPSFAPFFAGRTVSPDRAPLADYVVLGPSQPAHEPTRPLAHTIGFGFLNHAVVLTNTAPSDQAAYLSSHAQPDDLILLDTDTPLLRRYEGPGTLLSAASLPDEAAVADWLAQQTPGHESIWLVASPGASPIAAAHVRRQIQAVTTPVATATVASAAISEYAVHNQQPPHPDSQLAAFGGYLTLIDALLPTDPVNAPFPVFLRWQAPAPTPTDLRVSLYLEDLAGHLWAEVGQLVLNDVTFPTSAWAPDEWADNALTLRPPERIPPDAYAVQLIVTDGTDAQLGAWDASRQFQGVRVPLGEVKIAPPAKPLGPAPCTDGDVVTVGPLLACLPDLPPQAIPSGDQFTLGLTWSATAPPQSDYHVRWRLLDPGGSVALEQVADLAPYATSRWRAGDSFEARYDLHPDPTLPAAVYTLALNVLTPDGQPLWRANTILTTIEILPRDRLFELPADIAHPLDLTLGETVHLRGYDLPPRFAAEETEEGFLQPGSTLPLILYWQAEGPTEVAYTVFVHLVGPDGQLHGQVDRLPARGAAPTTSWVADQVIVDEIRLPVAADAPAGRYRIAVGMYDAACGGRLPVADASGQPLPNDQAILPVEIAVSGGQP